MQTLKTCIIMIYKLLIFKSTNDIFTTILIGLLHVSINEIFLCKSLILFNFLHPTSIYFATHKPMQRKVKHGERKCYPISLQNFIWNNNNSKKQLPHVQISTGSQIVYMFNPILPICPILTLPACFPNTGLSQNATIFFINTPTSSIFRPIINGLIYGNQTKIPLIKTFTTMCPTWLIIFTTIGLVYYKILQV